VKSVAGVIGGFVAGIIVTGGIAMATPLAVQAVRGNSVFKLNGQSAGSAPKLVYGGTTYVQLYSIEQALKKAGIGVNWDGTKDPGIFSMTTSTGNSSTSSSSPVTFSNTVVKSDGFGGTEVDGEVTNNSGTTHDFTLVVSFFDANGKLLGTAEGAVNGLGAGQTKTFIAMGTSDYINAASFKVQVDTMID